MQTTEKQIFRNIKNYMSKKHKNFFNAKTTCFKTELNIINNTKPLNLEGTHLFDSIKKRGGLKFEEANTSGIILITFSQINTRVNFLDSSGKILFSQSPGSVGLKSRQKKNRKLTVKKLLSSLNKTIPYLVEKKNPIALHLKNVGGELKYITKLVKECFLIHSLKSYENIPFNGCRRKKIRRKKYVKLIRR